MTKKILLIVFLVGLFVSPFVYNPNAAIPYEVPKVWFVRFWIETLVILGVVFYNKKARKEKSDRKLNLLVISFGVVALTTALTGLDVTKSFSGNYFRNDGLLTFFHLVFLFFFLQIYLRKDWIDKFVKVVVSSGVILSITSISVWILINVFNKYGIETWIDDSIGLTFGNPNFLTGYLLLCLSLAPSFSWIFLIPAILLTKAWIGVVGILVFLSIRFKPLIFFILLMAILFFSQLNFAFTNSAESRERIYTKGLLAIKNRPLLGYGWSNFDYAFKAVDYPIHFENDVYVDKAHSSILEVLVTTGVIGLIIYLLIIYRVIKNLLDNRLLLIGFVLLVLHMQTNVVSISEELIFWLYISIASKSKSTTP